MVRKLVAACVLALVAVGGFAQVDIDIDETDPALIDPQQVDLSEPIVRRTLTPTHPPITRGANRPGIRYNGGVFRVTLWDACIHLMLSR